MNQFNVFFVKFNLLTRKIACISQG